MIFTVYFVAKSFAVKTTAISSRIFIVVVAQNLAFRFVERIVFGAVIIVRRENRKRHLVASTAENQRKQLFDF